MSGPVWWMTFGEVMARWGTSHPENIFEAIRQGLPAYELFEVPGAGTDYQELTADEIAERRPATIVFKYRDVLDHESPETPFATWRKLAGHAGVTDRQVRTWRKDPTFPSTGKDELPTRSQLDRWRERQK